MCKPSGLPHRSCCLVLVEMTKVEMARSCFSSDLRMDGPTGGFCSWFIRCVVFLCSTHQGTRHKKSVSHQGDGLPLEISVCEVPTSPHRGPSGPQATVVLPPGWQPRRFGRGVPDAAHFIHQSSV